MDAETFLKTIRQEVLDPAEYGDVSGVSSILESLQPAIEILEHVDSRHEAELFFEHPQSLRLAALLLGTTERDLKKDENRALLASQLERWRSWTQGESLRGVVVGLLLSQAHSSRKDRRRKKFERIVYDSLNRAVSEINPFYLRVQVRVNVASRNFDFVITEQGSPIIAIADVFQIGTGGRQGDVLREYLYVQERLDQQNIPLIVIADGPGFASMTSLVRQILPRLRYITNIHGLESGEIRGLIDDALANRKNLLEQSTRQRDVEATRIARLTIGSGQIITPKVLGLDPSDANAFLLRFRATNPEYALISKDEGQVEAEASSELREVANSFNLLRSGRDASIQNIIESLANWLNCKTMFHYSESELAVFSLSQLDLPLRFPDPLPIFIVSSTRASSRSELIESLDHALSHGAVVGRLAILVDAFQPESSRSAARRLSMQRQMQIAVLDEQDITEILLRDHVSAQKYLVQLLLRNADLSLVSPFVPDGPTPPDMFFGRDTEIRQIVEQITNQSFALVGGRKAGKTSILQRLKTHLLSRGKVYTLDCQAHPDREDFLAHLRSETEDSDPLPSGKLSPYTERILTSFIRSKFGNSFGVLLIDEVDDLFYRDAHDREYPHVLSRAMRALSQARLISIVVTGERSLFALTRDPSSPHWNFCTPLCIGPLEVEAARRLLKEPLASLQIQITDKALDAALESTARHPNLLQFLGAELVALVSPASHAGETLQIGASSIHQVANSPSFRERFITTFWSQSTTLEKLISIALTSSEPQTVDQIRERIDLPYSVVKASDVAQALAYLELYTIAKATSEGYIYSSKIFERFLAIVSSGLVDEWRDELSQKGSINDILTLRSH